MQTGPQPAPAVGIGIATKVLLGSALVTLATALACVVAAFYLYQQQQLPLLFIMALATWLVFTLSVGFLGIHLRRALGRLVEELHERNRVLEWTRSEAEDASGAKDQFLANMSHEIRSPLNGIIGMATILLEEDLGHEQRKRLAILLRSAESLLGVLNDILDISKLDADAVTLEAVPLDLKHLTRELLEEVQPEAHRKGLGLTLEYEADVPRHLRADPSRMRQVLTNLLDNAIKFTREGKVTVSVKCTREDKERATLRLAVADTGIGISRAQQKEIFTPFHQADASTTRRFGGTGLGLAICSRLVQAMGGELELESALEEGTVFAFTVQLARCSSDEVQSHRSATGMYLRLGARVLLVEDDPVSRLVGEELLRLLGCTVELASDGEAALNLALASEHDLILMDLAMPRLDGLEATRRIRAEEAERGLERTPIVALTARAMQGDQERCKDAGMDGYLSKPVRKDALAGVLAKYLGEAPGIPQAKIDTWDDQVLSHTPAVHNRERMEANLDGNRRLADLALGAFMEDAPALIEELERALEQGTHECLERTAHRLRGSSATICADRLEQAASELEKAAASRRGSRCAGAMASVRRAYRELRAALGSRPTDEDKPQSAIDYVTGLGEHDRYISDSSYRGRRRLHAPRPGAPAPLSWLPGGHPRGSCLVPPGHAPRRGLRHPGPFHAGDKRPGAAEAPVRRRLYHAHPLPHGPRHGAGYGQGPQGGRRGLP